MSVDCFRLMEKFHKDRKTDIARICLYSGFLKGHAVYYVLPLRNYKKSSHLKGLSIYDFTFQCKFENDTSNQKFI